MPTVKKIKKTIEDYAANIRVKFKDSTSGQMERFWKPPTGGMSRIAFSRVILEKKAEEYRAASVAKLRTILNVTTEQLTDDQLEPLIVEGEANDRCGIVLKLKTDVIAEKEADRLKLEAEHG